VRWGMSPRILIRARPIDNHRAGSAPGGPAVEANLARIYRRLGIDSRAELGRIIGDL
jgi:hypothetical protein